MNGHTRCRASCATKTQIHAPSRYETNFAEFNIPGNYEEALCGPDASRWIGAIEEELKAHKENNTWQIIPRDHEKKMIDSRWMFKVIRGADERALRFKARLCARGFLQEKGLDFTEIFSPVVCYDLLRVLLATVTQEDLEMVQFNVRTAFLYGKLEEEIHMEMPAGLKNIASVREVVCQLKKSLYG
ncbi:gag-pol polyprotein [Lasius niger]|uniref:Gag-pol polyprotein n=1 Tax=Lasius niger TaxID=67767 RepID=A0A0J7K6P5_LASNI|nr:gag-pol polyprotein [Lasius niger]